MPTFARNYEEQHELTEKHRIQRKIRKLYEETPKKILVIEKEFKVESKHDRLALKASRDIVVVEPDSTVRRLTAKDDDDSRDDETERGFDSENEEEEGTRLSKRKFKFKLASSKEE